MTKKYEILSEIANNISDKYPYIDETDIYNISRKYYSRYFSEGVTQSSVKKLCTDGLKKISSSTNSDMNSSRAQKNIDLIQNCESDIDVTKILDKEFQNIFGKSAIPEETLIGCINAGKITYNLNREVGRNRLVSYILAWSVMLRFFYLKLFKKNKLDKLNKYINGTVKKPVLVSIVTILTTIVLVMIPILVGKSLFNRYSMSARDLQTADNIKKLKVYGKDVFNDTQKKLIDKLNSAISPEEQRKILSKINDGFNTLVPPETQKAAMKELSRYSNVLYDKFNTLVPPETQKAGLNYLSNVGNAVLPPETRKSLLAGITDYLVKVLHLS